MLAGIGARLNPKDAKPQPKNQERRAVAAPVTVPLPIALAPPLPGGEAPAKMAAGSPAEMAKPAFDPTANADSARVAANQAAPQNGALAAGIEMAFAVRVQPSSAAKRGPGAPQLPAQREMEPSAQPIPKKATENTAADQTVVQPVSAVSGSLLASYGQPSAHAELVSPPAAAPAEAPRPVEAKVLETPPKPAAVPLKDISLQVAQSGEQKVEVRVVQQSGELRVAVRTGDSDLAHGLQQGLSDLVGRLQDNGFRAEAWRPGGSVVPSGPVLEPHSSPSGSQRDDSQPHSGGSHQQQDERRQSQSQRPAWVEAFENSTTGSEQSQGVTYGISS